MSFFNSEIVRAEMTEIQELQDEVYTHMFKFSTMGKEQKVQQIDLLEKLIEKQKVLYARLSLSDDPEAKVMKQNIIDSAITLGMPPETDMVTIFKNMEIMIQSMKDFLDNQ